MEQSNQRVYIFDNLKFILMFFVVLGHCEAYLAKSDYFLKSVFCFIYFFHMPGFIFLSGLFSNKTVDDKGRTFQRIRYFLIMYLALNIFCSLLDIVYYRHYAFNLFNCGGLPWFMLVLAYHFGLTFLLKRFDHRLVLILSILAACISGNFDCIGDFLCLSRAIVYFPFFFLGYMIDWKDLLEWTKKKYLYVVAAAVIAGFAWLCVFRLDLVWAVKPLFSGHNPFSHLKYPEAGGLLRLLYYPAVLLFLCSMITLTPQRKTWFSAFGQRTLQVYFLQYSVIHALNVTGFFEYFMNNYPAYIWYFSYLPVSLAITVFFSLPIWGKIIRILFKSNMK